MYIIILICGLASYIQVCLFNSRVATMGAAIWDHISFISTDTILIVQTLSLCCCVTYLLCYVMLCYSRPHGRLTTVARKNLVHADASLVRSHMEYGCSLLVSLPATGCICMNVPVIPVWELSFFWKYNYHSMGLLKQHYPIPSNTHQ